MLDSTSPGATRAPDRGEIGFTLERLEWLVRLRWMALLGIVIAAIFAAAGAFPGVNVPVLFATAAAATLYNAAMWRDLQKGRAETGQRAAIQHATIDFMLLTIVLWAAGGLESPFVSYYVFHVTLVGILFGPRATLLAAGLALACAGLLWTTELVPALRIARWHPEGMWGPFATVVAFVSTLGAIAYLVNHAAAELRDRERALEQARDRAELEYELLSTTLDQLDAGLEVLDGDHNIVWRNRRAQQLAPEIAVRQAWRCPGTERPCERDASGVCPIERSFEHGEAGRCKFAFGHGGPERVYELLSFPLSTAGDKPRVMNLYLDRTNATLAERQLLLAERLASLGRVAQGVAHELNTPLATIRTLAADMGSVLPTLPDAPPEQRALLVRDVSESAALIKEETARLGRITHALLAGGDLVRVRVQGAVPLGAVVERACALVFAGVRSGANVELDPSLDGVRLRCDQDRLLQVLVNLLQNAHDALRSDPAAPQPGALGEARSIRSSKIGTVRLSAHVAEGAVTLRVEDDGPGIDPTLEGRLFEPFTTTKPVGEGTGLGLYTSYMLVRAMHGALALENRPEGGARASLTLPLDNAQVDAHSGAVSERPAERPGAA